MNRKSKMKNRTPLRPVAWTDANWLRSSNGGNFMTQPHPLFNTPLYDQASIDAAIAAERARGNRKLAQAEYLIAAWERGAEASDYSREIWVLKHEANESTQVMDQHDTEQSPVKLAPSRKGRVYVAGPMTGLPEFNFPAFHAEAARLRTMGLTVLNPAEHGVVEGATWADYLRHDLAGLMSCERIHLLRGWSKACCTRLRRDEVSTMTELEKAALMALEEAHMLILPIPAPEVSALELAKAVSERATKIAVLLTQALATTEPDAAVRVCPTKDSVFGDRPDSWCEACPKRQEAQPESDRATREAGQRARMQARFAARPRSKATADFDLPAQNDAPQQATPEPIKPFFATSIASRKWAELQEQGHRMQTLWFDGGPGGAGTIDPWGKVTWSKTEPATPERKGEPGGAFLGYTYQGEIDCSKDPGRSGAFWSCAPDDHDAAIPVYAYTSTQVPEGFALVPVEPTPAMKSAGIEVEVYNEAADRIGALTWREVASIYRAMIDAARKGE